MGSNDTPRKPKKIRPLTGPMRAMLAALNETGNIAQAARAAGCERRRHWDWLKIPEYAERAAEAIENSIEAMEQEARRRAVEGIPEPVFYQGKAVGAVRRYSDTLLIFLLKAHRPEKYRDRYESTVKHEGSISFTQALAMLRPERRDAADAVHRS